ncbi:MAG: serine/threonine protein kinase [Pseudonocardiales bacterium]|nr:serine/threonine protein kinase [Pseudonocardiales bacterium]
MVVAVGTAGEVSRPVPVGVAVSGAGELIAGRYRLISRLGSGSMGVVWQARDEHLDRTVAIKQLVLPSRLSDIETDEANCWAMREGRITARVQHPHVITIHDVVKHHGQPCLIMEYLPARSLATVLSTHGVLAPDIVAGIGSQIASALAAAHQAGIVHRDIKPGNVLLADDGTAKITDFGVSHAVGDDTVTATGILAGTPAYLAPEVAQGNSAGFPSDVFSLGSTLYTALEGAPPFGLSDNPIALLRQVTAAEITPPRQSGPLTPLLLRLLQRDPEHRPTMHQAQEALATLAAGLAGFPGDLSAPTLPLSRNDPPLEPVPRSQQTLLWAAAPEQTTIPAGLTRVDGSAGRPPTEGVDVGWSGRHQLLAGAMAVVLLTAGVLVTMLVGHGRVPSGHAAALASTSGVTANSIRALPLQPRLSDPTPMIIPPTPAIPNRPPDTPEQLPQTITDYHTPMPGNPAAGNRLPGNVPPHYARGVTAYQIQRQQSPPGPDQLRARYRGWSGKHRHARQGH